MKPCISAEPLILELGWSWVVEQHFSCSSVRMQRPIIRSWADIGRLDDSLTYWTFRQASWNSRTVEAECDGILLNIRKPLFTPARSVLLVNWENYWILKCMKIVTFKGEIKIFHSHQEFYPFSNLSGNRRNVILMNLNWYLRGKAAFSGGHIMPGSMKSWKSCKKRARTKQFELNRGISLRITSIQSPLIVHR